MVTINPAKQLGVDDRVGQVALGRGLRESERRVSEDYSNLLRTLTA